MIAGLTGALGAQPLRSRPAIRVVDRPGSFTLTAADHNTLQLVSGTSVVTIPPLYRGFQCLIEQTGSGDTLVTFSPMATTIADLQARGGDTIKTTKQFSRASVFFKTHNLVAIDGDLTVTA